MTRRNLELILLCIAAPLVILMFAMLVVNQGQPLNFNTLGVPIGIFAAFVVAHLAVRKLAPGADPAILPITFALSGIGIAFVTRLRPELAVGQLMWLFVGVAFLVLALLFVRNLDRLARLERERADRQPDAASVDLLADERDERGEQQDEAHQHQRVLVAGEPVQVAHEQQR